MGRNGATMGEVRGDLVGRGGKTLPNHLFSVPNFKSRIANRMAISPPSLRMWGRFEHSLDDKGRVIVPQKFRDKLGEEFVLTIGPDHHIRAYPMPIWDAMDEQLASVDVLDELNKDVIF